MSNKKKLKNKFNKKNNNSKGYQPPDWKAFKNTWALPERVGW